MLSYAPSFVYSQSITKDHIHKEYIIIAITVIIWQEKWILNCLFIYQTAVYVCLYSILQIQNGQL